MKARTIAVLLLAASATACGDDTPTATTDTSPCASTDGQCIFRHDTFGDEQLWTDTLRLHELVQNLPPKTALGVGLKVDAEAVPADVLASADLDDPATTAALIQLNAVVGVRGTVENGRVTRIGITCALCHSTVDDSVAPGIGKRLDGWPNRTLDPGAIIAGSRPACRRSRRRSASTTVSRSPRSIAGAAASTTRASTRTQRAIPS